MWKFQSAMVVMRLSKWIGTSRVLDGSSWLVRVLTVVMCPERGYCGMLWIDNSITRTSEPVRRDWRCD